MEMNIRLIKKSDLLKYIELVNELNYENDEVKNKSGITKNIYTYDIKEYEKRIDKLINSEYHFIFIGEINNELICTTSLSICLDLSENLNSLGFLENIIVNKKYRGKGYGKKMLNHVESFAKAKNCNSTAFISSGHRIEAHKFYDKLGYNKYPVNGYKKFV